MAALVSEPDIGKNPPVTKPDLDGNEYFSASESSVLVLNKYNMDWKAEGFDEPSKKLDKPASFLIKNRSK